MHIYKRKQIAERVKLDATALEAVEAGFAALGRGEVEMPPILSMNIAESNGEVDVKTAHIRGWPRFAIKISPGFFDNPKLGLPSLNGLMLLFSAKTGLVEAVLFDEGYLTDIRTALAGAIAAKHLARADAHSVAVIGAGLQAELQVAALRLVRDIHEVHVYARDHTKAEAYATHMRAHHGLPVTVHTSAASAAPRPTSWSPPTPAREPAAALERPAKGYPRHRHGVGQPAQERAGSHHPGQCRPSGGRPPQPVAGPWRAASRPGTAA